MATLLRTDFNDFLFAPVADEANGMHLTMLSVLGRMGVDPWVEAADLAALSREAAMQKLMTMLAGVPSGPLPGPDTETAAARLIELLHSSPKPRVATASVAPSRTIVVTPPKRLQLVIYSLLALILLLVGNWVLNSSPATTPADTSAPSQ